VSTSHRPPSATCPACGDVVDYLTEHIAQVGADPRPGGWDDDIDYDPGPPVTSDAESDRAADRYDEWLDRKASQ